MMQPDPALHKLLIAVLLVTAHDTERGTAADAVEHFAAVNDGRHSEERQQLLVERARGLEICGSQNHVRHAVDFHKDTSPDWSAPFRRQSNRRADEEAAIHQP